MIGVNVQAGSVTPDDTASLSRFTKVLGIWDWEGNTRAVMAILQAGVNPEILHRWTQDPRTWAGWPADYIARGKVAVFGNEPDLEGAYPKWYDAVAQAWRAYGGLLAEPAWHDEKARVDDGRTYDVVTAHSYSGDFSNLEMARSRANGRTVIVTEYARQNEQQQCVQDLRGISEDVYLFAFRWSGSGSQPGFDVVGVDLGDLCRYTSDNGSGDRETSMDAETQAAIDAINKRIALQTAGLRRVVEGHYSGAAGAAAIVLALEGGTTTIEPQPDVNPNS